MKQASLLLLVILLLGNLSAKEIELDNNKPRLKLSFTERLRLVSWDNAITLDDDADGTFTFTRHRTSMMGQWYPTSRFELALKLTNEFRYYFSPDDRDFNLNEIFVDQLYLKWKDPLNIKGSLTLGRQNLILGEGFVVMDGGPLVGSRSIYFNAARFDWRVKENNELTIFYLNQPETDNILPIINDRNTPLIEKPEEAFGLYYKTSKKNLKYDVYYIRKNIKKTDTSPSHYERNTIGLRFNDESKEIFPLTCKFEGAFQFGKSNDRNVYAAGGYFEIIRNNNWAQNYLPKNISLGIIYLSKKWDPLFSRWPKWSESYIYTQIKENKVAYWTNMVAVSSGMDLIFNQNISFNFDYLHLIAAKTVDLKWSFINSRNNTRGNLFISKINFKVNKNLTGHFLWEYFKPGDFYNPEADSYNWARFELMYKISN